MLSESGALRRYCHPQFKPAPQAILMYNARESSWHYSRKPRLSFGAREGGRGGGAGEEADTVGELGWETEAWSRVRKEEKRRQQFEEAPVRDFGYH